MQLARPFLAVLLAITLGAATAGATSYAVDGAGSNVSAKVAFFGIGSKTAAFPSVSGTARLGPGDPQQIDLDVTIDARMLSAPDKTTRERLKGEKFFWVEKYPTVHFVGRRLEMTAPTTGTVHGRLTARGVTRDEQLSVTFDIPPDQAAPGKAVTLDGEMQIDRRNYGMTAYNFIVGKMVTIRLRARMLPG